MSVNSGAGASRSFKITLPSPWWGAEGDNTPAARRGFVAGAVRRRRCPCHEGGVIDVHSVGNRPGACGDVCCTLLGHHPATFAGVHRRRLSRNSEIGYILATRPLIPTNASAKKKPRKSLRGLGLEKRRARDSNSQPLAGHHISSVAANHSLTLRSPCYTRTYGLYFGCDLPLDTIRADSVVDSEIDPHL